MMTRKEMIVKSCEASGKPILTVLQTIAGEGGYQIVKINFAESGYYRCGDIDDWRKLWGSDLTPALDNFKYAQETCDRFNARFLDTSEENAALIREAYEFLSMFVW